MQMCQACIGSGCEKCSNKGHFIQELTPEKLITDDAQDLFKGYIWLDKYNIFPGSGGIMDQSVRFMRAVEFVENVTAKMGEIKKQKEAENRKQAKLLMDMKTKSKGARRG